MFSTNQRCYRASGIVILCLLLSGAANASDFVREDSIGKTSSAYELLTRMSSASRSVSYGGRFIYMANSSLRALKVIHTTLNGQEYERLTPLSGGGPEILRKGDELICLHPEGSFMRLDNSIPSGPFANKFSQVGENIDQYYRLLDEGLDQVAGRETTRYLMQPLDQYRYGYSVWIDNKSGLLLKTTLRGENAEELETFEYVELNVGIDLPLKLFEYKPTGKDDKSLVVNLAGEMSSNLDADWEAGWVPGGFSMAACDVRHISEQSKEVNALVYSDGISSFTVFIEPFSSAKGDTIIPSKHQGATAMHSHTVRDGSHSMLVTVVGELPMSAIEKIGASVVRKN